MNKFSILLNGSRFLVQHLVFNNYEKFTPSGGQQCHAGHLQLEYVPSNDQKGDIFTKVLHTPQHEALRKSLNCMTIHEFRSRYNQRESKSKPACIHRS